MIGMMMLMLVLSQFLEDERCQRRCRPTFAKCHNHNCKMSIIFQIDQRQKSTIKVIGSMWVFSMVPGTLSLCFKRQPSVINWAKTSWVKWKYYLLTERKKKKNTKSEEPIVKIFLYPLCWIFLNFYLKYLYVEGYGENVVYWWGGRRGK